VVHPESLAELLYCVQIAVCDSLASLFTADKGTSTQGDTFWNGETFQPGGSSGGDIWASLPEYRSGGGGGAGGEPSDFYKGGNGVLVSITSTPTMYAGGGGAGGVAFNL